MFKIINLLNKYVFIRGPDPSPLCFLAKARTGAQDDKIGKPLINSEASVCLVAQSNLKKQSQFRRRRKGSKLFENKIICEFCPFCG